MGTVYLARHGETDWNLAGRWQGHTDIALNQAGREQARTLAEALRGLGIDRVHSSDLARARETAEIVAAALGLGAVVIDPALRERSFGVFEGLTRDECAARHPEAWSRYRADPRQTPPGAEPQEALVRRLLEAVRRAAAGGGAAGSAPLVVSHGGSVRTLLALARGALPPPVANGAVFRVMVTSEGLCDPEWSG